MLVPDKDRPVVQARSNLLRMALRARLERDWDFFRGLPTETAEELRVVCDAFHEFYGFMNQRGQAKVLQDLGAIVDELTTDGWSETARNLLLQYYETVPVSPREFFSNPYYAGKFGEGLYPMNFRDLCWMCEVKNRILEVIMTGALRWGKTSIAVLMTIYRIYLLSLLRDPQAYFGLIHASSIRYGVFNVYKYKTSEMYDRLRNIIDDSPYFREKFPRLDQTISKRINLPKHVSIIEGADELAALGETLTGALLDEVNFMKIGKSKGVRERAEQSLGQAQKLYNAIRTRLRNQFVASPGTFAPYFMCVMSQRLAQTSFLERHIALHAHEEGVVVISRAIWDVQPPGTYCGKTFFLFCGDSSAGPRILSDEGFENIDDTSNVAEVPVEHLDDFKGSNISEAIRGIAGRATVAASGLFHRPDVIREAVDPNLVHPFRSPYVVLSTKAAFEIQHAAREDVLFEMYLSGNRPRLHPGDARVMHIDLAVTDCPAGIACVHRHVEGTMDAIFVDFMLQIIPPAEGYGEIDFDKIINFIRYLKTNGFRFHLVSFDKYQSRHSKQILEKMGTSVDFISVDETDDPYINLRGVFESHGIKMYEYPIVQDELARLEHDITARKVYKPYGSTKDVADALAGAVYGLIPGRKRPNKEKLLKTLPVGSPSVRFPMRVTEAIRNA